jgi:starch synthase (maltosyl-transferring)
LTTAELAIKASVSTLRRVVIENVDPEIDGGRFPIKRVVGEKVLVQADVYADGHDAVGAALLYRRPGESLWHEEAMSPVDNDRWQGGFSVDALGTYEYTVAGWVDKFQTWSRNLRKKADASQDISVDLLIGAAIVRQASERAKRTGARALRTAADKLANFAPKDRADALRLAENAALLQLVNRHREFQEDSRYERELKVSVDRGKARFSAWYEMFPRSCTTDAHHHGTFHDCIARLDYIAGMGFDVLYLPPIHPIGFTERRGKNNSVTVSEEDVGSPWAIGSRDGGHKSIHPQLGSLEDFKQLQAKARELGVEIAIDIAFQSSPDHPYVHEHREWFRQRPDGTVQYAENPPKKYQDIYPFDFETQHAAELWQELKSVFVYWAEQGIRIFRVDNPHTKPFAFWEWVIAEIKGQYPEVLFLSEAFTRPKVMYHLAKLGFTQSYTYFTWRNTSEELTDYFTELTQPPVREVFRANLWTNTPDILHAFLQHGGRPAFVSRLILAATLGANYGIYGPAFELYEGRPIREGSEEYLDSEKYQIRVWDIDNPNSLKDLMTRVN